MGEPIAGRISPEAKERLEAEAADRGVSVSELTGSIVTLWLRKQAVDQADDPADAKEGEPFDKSLQQVYDELEALRWVLGTTARGAQGVRLKTWVETQVFTEERGYSELEPSDYTPL